jgi:hypothetical protein
VKEMKKNMPFEKFGMFFKIHSIKARELTLNLFSQSKRAYFQSIQSKQESLLSVYLAKAR